MRPPPLCVAALNLRTHVNPATHAHEVAAATIMVMTGVDVEGACADWRVRRKDGFVCVTRIDGTVLPAGLEEAARKEDVPLRSQPSERALLAFLLAKLHEMGEAGCCDSAWAALRKLTWGTCHLTAKHRFSPPSSLRKMRRLHVSHPALGQHTVSAV